jgi:serine/threonine protein kinase
MIPDYQEVQPGDVVDFRYHAFRPVARGGMGMVFAARHNVLDEVLAIKCMPKAALKNDAERARLMRESVALARCRHPHIVSVRDAGVCAKHGPYVALELLTGRSLAGLLASRGRMTLPDGIEFVRQCAGALDHAHARLVIHRDLKPANIFIAASPSGRDVIKIIDFGVAYDREASTKLTEEGRTVGTLDYMAPEQLMGRETHAPADVWGLAVTFFEAITGRLPFLGAPRDVLSAVARGETPPPISTLIPGAPPALDDVLARAFTYLPTDRYPSASAFARALMQVVAPSEYLCVLDPKQTVVPTLARSPEAPFAPPVGPQITPVPLLRRANPDATTTPQPPPLPSSGGAELRRDERVPFICPVQVFGPDALHKHGRSEDISATGLLVLTDHKYENGERVQLRFPLPISGKIVEVEGVCRWTKMAARHVATGFAFENAPAPVMAEIREFVTLNERRRLPSV